MYKLLVILAFVSTLVLSAQISRDSIIHIKGMVFDSDGNPVKKAIIYRDSVKTSTRTNKRGFYTIDVPMDTRQLMAFSSKYGMVAGDLEGNELNFQFQKDQPKVSETDLKQLGFTVDRNRKGRIDPANYEDYNSIYELIGAMFTGVSVRGNTVTVRGFSSLGAGAASTDADPSGTSTSEPLFIVDGNYVLSKDLDQFLPRDVKSIELLKNSDATLYGARGATGVFVITLNK